VRDCLGSGFRLGSTMEFSGYDDSLNAVRLAALERGAAPSARTAGRGGARALVRLAANDLRRPAGHRPRAARPHVWLAAGHGMLGISMSAAPGS
jgi:D-amino-acid dehydrogenase